MDTDTDSRATDRASSPGVVAWFIIGAAIGLALLLAVLAWAVATSGVTSA